MKYIYKTENINILFKKAVLHFTILVETSAF